MDAQDRAETRQMITDIVGSPLETIHGKLNLILSQNSNIEIQTIKTNSRVTHLEENLGVLQGKVDNELPHTVSSCPQGPILEDIKIDIAVIKSGKDIKLKFQDTLRTNLGLILVGIGLVINMIISYSNHQVSTSNNKLNSEQLTNQKGIVQNIKAMLKSDSILIEKHK
jgi:hypothetical protein